MLVMLQYKTNHMEELLHFQVKKKKKKDNIRKKIIKSHSQDLVATESYSKCTNR